MTKARTARRSWRWRSIHISAGSRTGSNISSRSTTVSAASTACCTGTARRSSTGTRGSPARISASRRNKGRMSSRLQLSISFAANPRTWPLIDGAVTVDGVDLVITPSHPSEIFWRQLKFGDFDISEMSMSSLMMALAHGDDRFVGIPVFTTHRFFHTSMLVRRDAGIETPADLKGKRVGVPEYQQTAALWTRGALQHEWGVTAQDMEWWMERPASHSHGGATGFKPPPGVTVHPVPVETNLGNMVVEGELDAVVHYIVNDNLVDRSKIDLFNHPAAKRMFADPIAEGIRYYGR